MIAELQNAVRRIFGISPRTTQGVGLSYLIRSSLVVAILPLLIVPVPASGQAKPEPPTLLCVEGSSDCETSSVGQKKWNPGHYLKTQGQHASADKAAYVSKITRELAKTGDSPSILGAFVSYSWGMIEPSVGNYDWEPIQTQLDFLSSRGKKLILVIEIKCFGSDCSNLAPSELAGEVFATDRGYRTEIIEIWEERNMDLFIAFWRALAAEFDSNPALELVLSSESTASLAGSSPANYNRAEYAKQLKRLYAAQAGAFKTTNVVANVNFLSGQVSDLIENAYNSGLGRHMPDAFDSDGTVIFRGECVNGQCGVRDYRGLVPHSAVVSFPTLRGDLGAATDSPAEVIAFGLTNKVSHFSWISSAEGSEDSWPTIISAIESASQNIYAACPELYAGSCQ